MLRILATSDLGAATWPLRTSYGESGTIAGVVELLERSREKRPTVWLELGDLVVGHPSFPLLGERPWDDVADLPIAAAAAGNHDFDDGLDALHAAAARLSRRADPRFQMSRPRQRLARSRIRGACGPGARICRAVRQGRGSLPVCAGSTEPAASRSSAPAQDGQCRARYAPPASAAGPRRRRARQASSHSYMTGRRSARPRPGAPHPR